MFKPDENKLSMTGKSMVDFKLAVVYTCNFLFLATIVVPYWERTISTLGKAYTVVSLFFVYALQFYVVSYTIISFPLGICLRVLTLILQILGFNSTTLFP